jgi:hypothetical protein
MGMKKLFQTYAQKLSRQIHALVSPQQHGIKSGQYKNIDALMKAVYALPSTPYIAIEAEDFIPTEGIEVGMNCAGITDAQSERPILGTYGIASCMGIAVYNPALQTGGLAHLAQSPTDCVSLSSHSEQAIQKLFKTIRTDQNQPLEVRLMGPMHNAKQFIGEVLTLLNDTPKLRILSADYIDKPYVTAFAMDTRRWKEGLIKGGNSSGLNIMNCTETPESFARYIEGNKHRVEISDLSPARHYTDGLYDERSPQTCGKLVPRQQQPTPT